MLRTMLSLVFPLLLAPLAPASTWIVDDNSGPGVDFTSIQAAVNASSPGDVLLVQPGAYGSFTVSIPLSILGQGAPTIAFPGKITVSNLAAGGRVAVVGFIVQGSSFSSFLFVQNCAGKVIGDDLHASSSFVDVTGSADVRLRRVTARQLRSTQSRVEVVESGFQGNSPPDCFCCSEGDDSGGTGFIVTGGELHLARSSSIGGNGADETCIDTGLCNGGGPGGHGVALQSGASALVTGGPAHVLSGGTGGIASGSCASFGNGSPGESVWIGSGAGPLRISGVTADGTTPSVTPADPTMRLLETPVPGTNLTFRVEAPPGADVDIVLGRQPILADVPGLEEDVLTTTNRTFHLGTVPASGVVSLNFPTSASWPKGFLLVFQAVATLPDTSVRRTHSIPVVFR
jgi:hypothetical protein